MISLCSVWQDNENRQVLILGAHHPATTKTAAKRDSKLLGKYLKQWRQNIGEITWFVEERGENPVKETLIDRFVETVAEGERLNQEDCKENIVEVQCRLFSNLTRFLLYSIEYWRKTDMVDRESEDEKAQVSSFLELNMDTTWRELFEKVDDILELAKPYIQKHPHYEATMMLKQKIQATEQLKQQGEDFRSTHGADLNERYGETFFKAIMALEQQAVRSWTAWAEGLGHMAREILVLIELLEWKKLEGEKLCAGVILPSNFAVSVVEAMSSLGFSCAWVAGQTERQPPNVPMSMQQIQKNSLVKGLSSAFDLKPQTVEICQCCKIANVQMKNCGRCHSVSYCSQKCQKKDWKLHKKNCKSCDRK